VNVTAVNAVAPGYVSTWDGLSAQPLASTLNFAPGNAAVPNLAIVPTISVEDPPWFRLATSAPTNIIVDVVGYFDDGQTPGGLRFSTMTPTRIVDTRSALGATKLGPASTATIATPGTVAPAGTSGLALNVTAVTPSQTTYLSVWPAGIVGVGQPYVSNLNPNQGETIPNAVYTLIGPTAGFNIYNNAGSVDVVVDVVGAFWNLPADDQPPIE
jgi:hypothetical protein